MRFFGQLHVRILDIQSTHLHVIQQFNPRHRQSRLNGHHHRFNGTFNIFKGTGCGHHLFGLAKQPDRYLCDDAKRAFRPDKQMRQVVTG